LSTVRATCRSRSINDCTISRSCAWIVVAWPYQRVLTRRIVKPVFRATLRHCALTLSPAPTGMASERTASCSSVLIPSAVVNVLSRFGSTLSSLSVILIES